MYVRLPAGFTDVHKEITRRFVQGESLGLLHDFYITRVYEPRGRERIVVVFLKEPAWEAVDGETTPVTLEALAGVLPGVFRLQQNDTILIVLDYEEWKTRLLRAQKSDQEDRR